MVRYNIGEIVKQERERRGISQKELSKGICTAQTLSLIELGETETDKLSMDILLQRLGKSPDKLECILSVEEFRKIDQRMKIESAIRKNEGDKADVLLNAYREIYFSKSKVHKMYCKRTQACIMMYTGEMQEYSYRMRCVPQYLQSMLCEIQQYLEEAMSLLSPKWEMWNSKEQLLSTYELENILAYGKVLYMEGNEEKAVSIFKNSVRYIKENFSDQEEKAKIFPKCVWLLSVANQNREEQLSNLLLCEEAVKLLRDQGIIYFMRPVIGELIKRYQFLGAVREVTRYENYSRLLEELEMKYRGGDWKNCLFHNIYHMEYHLDFEVIRGERITQGYTQEELIEEIYQSPETLSRVENGKVSPNKDRFNRLMNRLGIKKTRYNGYVVADSFEVYEKKQEVDRLITKKRCREAEELLQTLNTQLEAAVPENDRYARRIQILLAYKKGKLTKKGKR